MNEDIGPEWARREIAQKIRQQDLWQSEAGERLRKLFPETKNDNLEVLEEEILLDGKLFSSSVVWHVTLILPNLEGSSLVSAETFPGIFRGHFENDIPVLDSLDVDFGSLSQPQPPSEDNGALPRSRAPRRRQRR